MKKILLYALLIVVMLIGGFLTYVKFVLPHAGPVEEITLNPAPEMLERGEYLVNAGACFDCHTRQEKGKYVGEPFAGGMEFTLPDGSVVVSRNITPHATGIGNWNEQFFVNRFRMYADSTIEPHAVAEHEFQTIMPWTMYAGMKDEDLKAMFAYMKTLRPVDNQVIPFKPAQQ